MNAELIIRILFLTGTSFILVNPFEKGIQKLRMNNRLKERRRAIRGKTVFERKVAELILVAFGKETEVGTFFLLDAFLMGGTFLLCHRILNAFTSVSAGFLMGVIPWLFIILRAENRRKDASREGIALISELLRNYRISGRNVLSSLEETAQVKELEVTGKLLYQLLLRARDAKGKETIDHATEDFAYALKTNWGNMLSYNLSQAIKSGRNIEGALEDLLVQLRDAEKLEEERKRMNSETTRIVNGFIPILYPASLLMMHKSMDLSWTRIIRNQFLTSEGLLFFLAMIFLWLLNMLFLNLVTGQKFDF